MSRGQSGKGGQEGHLGQREQPGKCEKAQDVDTEGALPQASFVSGSESSKRQVCPAPCDPHSHRAPHPYPQLDIIPIMAPEAREAPRG